MVPLLRVNSARGRIIGLTALCIVGCTRCGSNRGARNSNFPPDNPASYVRVEGPQRLELVSGFARVHVPFAFLSPGETVYLERCSGSAAWQLERWTDHQWQYAFSPDCYDVATPAIVITGATYSDTAVAILQAHAPDPLKRSLTAGVYRLVLFAFSHMGDESTLWTLGDTLALERRASSPFEIQ
ncbi:MAG: hypothetical protein ACJ796_05125 [Gemmatimonadaceae bacterium]